MELTAANAPEYLRSRGIIASRVEELGGGVSNTVLLVETNSSSFILKQALAKLRVKDDWRADQSRIFREKNSLVDAAAFLPAGSVPEVLWEDQENFAFAMTTVPGESWKARIFAGDRDLLVAQNVGELLGAFIAATWQNSAFREKYGDQTAFDQLRIDPYYRCIAERHPDIAANVQGLIEESSARRIALVHGDWSPKNILVADGKPTLIDFEVVHFGDPCFDAAFCLNHLVLKFLHLQDGEAQLEGMIYSYWTALERSLPPALASTFEQSTLRHVSCLLLARIDGKSPVEYIVDSGVRGGIRTAAKDLILNPPRTLKETVSRLKPLKAATVQ